MTLGKLIRLGVIVRLAIAAVFVVLGADVERQQPLEQPSRQPRA